MTPTQAVKLAETRKRLEIAALNVLVGIDKATDERIYFVESKRASEKNGFLTLRPVKKINGKFICTCEHGSKAGCVCVHCLAAYDREQADLAAADLARRNEYAAFRATYSDFFCGMEDLY